MLFASSHIQTWKNKDGVVVNTGQQIVQLLELFSCGFCDCLFQPQALNLKIQCRPVNGKTPRTPAALNDTQTQPRQAIWKSTVFTADMTSSIAANPETVKTPQRSVAAVKQKTLHRSTTNRKTPRRPATNRKTPRRPEANRKTPRRPTTNRKTPRRPEANRKTPRRPEANRKTPRWSTAVNLKTLTMFSHQQKKDVASNSLEPWHSV